MNIEEIQKILPHRYPFLLVDRIIKNEGLKIVGVKSVTVNEPFFQGHFPGHPIMPGVLIVEAMAQVIGCLVLSKPEFLGMTPYFLGIDKARFKNPVTPGDQLVIEGEILKWKGNICRAKAKAMVGDKLAASAELLFGVDVLKKS